MKTKLIIGSTLMFLMFILFLAITLSLSTPPFPFKDYCTKCDESSYCDFGTCPKYSWVSKIYDINGICRNIYYTETCEKKYIHEN